MGITTGVTEHLHGAPVANAAQDLAADMGPEYVDEPVTRVVA